MRRYIMNAVCEINPFQFNVTFDIETSHLICTANQMTGFHVKCDFGLKSVKYFLELKQE